MPSDMVLDHTHQSTVALLARQPGGGWAGIACGGVGVGRGRVVTAYHCTVSATHSVHEREDAEPQGRQVAIVRRGEYGRAGWLVPRPNGIVSRVDPDRDLALVETWGVDVPRAIIRRAPLPVGAPIYSWHHTGGYGWQFARGSKAGARCLDCPVAHSVDMYVARIAQGASGSGVWSLDGELSGLWLCIGGAEIAEYAGAVPAEDLDDWVR